MSVNDRLSNIEQGQARIGQQLTDFLGEQKRRDEEQAKRCANHAERIDKAHEKADACKSDYQSDKSMVLGAAKLLGWLSGGSALAAGLIRLMHHKGGTP